MLSDTKDNARAGRTKMWHGNNNTGTPMTITEHKIDNDSNQRLSNGIPGISSRGDDLVKIMNATPYNEWQSFVSQNNRGC